MPKGMFVCRVRTLPHQALSFTRNVFEQAVSMQAMRLSDVEVPSKDELTALEVDDIATV